MKKILYLALVISAVILLAWYSPSRNNLSSASFSNPLYPHADVLIGGEHFDAAVAETEALKEQGLSGFRELREHEAMFFPYEEPASLPFWMKGMLFSIDILWLDADFRVIHFQKNASPSSYPNSFAPASLAQYVIEFKAGTLDRLGVVLGDAVAITPRK